MAKLSKTVITQLQAIQASGRVTPDVGKPLMEAKLIEVNTADVVGDAAAARLTQLAIDSLPKPKVAVANPGAAPAASAFPILKGVVVPESKRGAGRVAGPSKYPFDTMEKGDTFFVPASEETPNPVKTLGSAVTNATNKYRVDTGTVKMVERSKRGEGNKAVLDAAGNKIKEQVQVPVYNYPRKFVIRSVKAGQACGSWVAPSDGALISREV